MDAFSYLSVLLSIIIGLAITQILQAYRGLMLNRARVRLYAPTLVWSALILLFATQSWWASFGLATHREWTFAGFAIVLLQTVFLYMMAGLVLPDMPADEPIDLREHYYREARPLFSIGIAMLVTSIVKDWMLDGRLPAPENIAFHAAFATIFLVAALARRPLVHEVTAPVGAALSLSYVAMLFARL